MRAPLMHGFHEPLTIAEVNVDEPRQGEVLVRLAASGICGSDVHALHGRANVTRQFPIILGHEGAGVIEAVGPGVHDVKRGDPVVIAMFGPCGHCEYCGEGRQEYCDGIERRSMWGEMPDGSTRLSIGGKPVFPFVGVGSLGEYAVVRREMVVPVPKDISLATLCIAACGVTTGLGAAFNVAKVTPGSTVMVVACGGVGLNIIQGARIAGASRILAFDINPMKLDIAANLGATHCFLGTDDMEGSVRSVCPKGVDFAFDVVGSPDLIKRMLPLTRAGGMTCAVGVLKYDQEIGATAGNFLFGERKLTGVMGGGNRPIREISRIVSLYQSGLLKLDELIGERFALDDVNKAFDAATEALAPRVIVELDSSLC